MAVDSGMDQEPVEDRERDSLLDLAFDKFPFGSDDRLPKGFGEEAGIFAVRLPDGLEIDLVTDKQPGVTGRPQHYRMSTKVAGIEFRGFQEPSWRQASLAEIVELAENLAALHDKDTSDELRCLHEAASDADEFSPEFSPERIKELREDIEAAIEMQVLGGGSVVELNPYLLGMDDDTDEHRTKFTPEEEKIVLELIHNITGIAPETIRAARPESGELIELPSPMGDLSLYVDIVEPDGRIAWILAEPGKTRSEFE